MRTITTINMIIITGVIVILNDTINDSNDAIAGTIIPAFSNQRVRPARGFRSTCTVRLETAAGDNIAIK